MGLIQCAKHGLQGLSFVSPKVAQYIINESDFDFEVEKIFLVGMLNNQTVHLVDREFVNILRNKYDIHNGDIKILDEEEYFEIMCQLKPVCSSCFKTIMKDKLL